MPARLVIVFSPSNLFGGSSFEFMIFTLLSLAPPAPWDSEALSHWGEIVKRYLTGIIFPAPSGVVIPAKAPNPVCRHFDRSPAPIRREPMLNWCGAESRNLANNVK